MDLIAKISIHGVDSVITRKNPIENINIKFVEDEKGKMKRVNLDDSIAYPGDVFKINEKAGTKLIDSGFASPVNETPKAVEKPGASKKAPKISQDDMDI